MSSTLTPPPSSPAPSSAVNSSQELAAVCHELERLRGRLKRLYGLHGLIRFGVELLGFVIVAFLADRVFATPREARLVQLVVVVGLIGWRLWQLVVYPMTRPIRLRDLAMAVERRFPVLDGRLISALDLGRRSDFDSLNLSPVLVGRLVDETLSLSRDVSFSGIFHYRPVHRLSGLLAGLALLIGVFVTVYPTQASVFLSRFLGSERPWPRATNLILQIPTDSPNYTVRSEGSGEDGVQDIQVVIAQGASLPVIVDVEGKLPETVNLVMDEQGGVRRDFTMRARGENEYFFRLRAMRRDAVLRVEGGDDSGDGRRVTISVRTPPTLNSVVAKLTPPPYTLLPPSEQQTGHIDAPVGTEVQLDLMFNVPVSEARLAFDGQLDEASILTADNAQNLQVRTARFTVEKSGSYALDLRGEDGFPNLDPIAFTIVAVEDKEPVVRVIYPDRPSIDVTSRAKVLFRVSGIDDYGVSAVRFAHRALGTESVTEIPLSADQLADPLPRPDFDGAMIWDFSDLQLKIGENNRTVEAGDYLEYHWVVEDNAQKSDGQPMAHLVTSNDRRIEVVSDAEKQRLLTERQVRLKKDVGRLKDEQSENADNLTAFLEVHDGGRAEFDGSDLVRIEIAQNRISQRAARLTGEFAGIFEEYLFNRLDDSSSAERLLQVHLEAKAAALFAEGFDVDLFLPRLEEFQRGDYGDMKTLSRLLGLLGIAVKISEQLSPEAYELLSQARVTADEEARPELISQAFDRQTETLAAFDELLSRMDDWEGFQEVLEALQDIIDTQQNVNSRYSEELKGDK